MILHYISHSPSTLQTPGSKITFNSPLAGLGAVQALWLAPAHLVVRAGFEGPADGGGGVAGGVAGQPHVGALAHAQLARVRVQQRDARRN